MSLLAGRVFLNLAQGTQQPLSERNAMFLARYCHERANRTPVDVYKSGLERLAQAFGWRHSARGKALSRLS